MELPTSISSLLRSPNCLPPFKCFESHSFSRNINRLRMGRHGVVPSSASVKMVSNGYVRRDSYRGYSNRIYKRVGSCLVIPPPKGKKPTAIIEFLGGAFIGAVPEVTYSYLIELLANEGFLIISVPYNVTFDHAQATREIYERFNSCLDTILTSGLPDASLSTSDLAHLPLYSVGHSNGALLQVLKGSYFSEKIPKANAIISYNNKPATEAVPYFEQIGPLVRQVMPIVEASPAYSLAQNASDAWKGLLDMAGTMILDNDQEALVSLTNFVDQLPSVMNQVTQGISEFRPTPSENRDYFKDSYNVQRTLLVKFNFDTIDETDLLEETLKPRVESIGGTLEKVSLNGNHITPCIQEPKWQVGYLYTPADAIAQGLKALSLSETRVLCRTITNWFRGLEDLCYGSNLHPSRFVTIHIKWSPLECWLNSDLVQDLYVGDWILGYAMGLLSLAFLLNYWLSFLSLNKR